MASDLPDVARALGLTLRGRRRLGPCPACAAERTSRNDRRAPVGYAGHGGWRCWACGATGDVVTLVSYALTGGPKGYSEAFAWLAERGVVAPRQRAPEPVQAPHRPPPADVREMWARAVPVSSHPAARAYLVGRGIDPDRAPARVVTWAPVWWPHHWWPLVVPAYGPDGTMVSIHGRAITADAPRKTTWPRGYDAGGLLFASGSGLALLRGQGATVALICEGVTDYLAACAAGGAYAVLGITSGSIPSLRAVAWGQARIVSALDPDPAGARYQEALGAAVAPRQVHRISWRM